jgi:paraquat-inducible protein B
MEPIIPVYIEFDADRFRPYVGEAGPNATQLAAELAAQARLKAAIAKGLHARLATQSLVTGQLLVELDLDPNEPTRTFGFDPKTVEIPTAQSDIEKLKTTLTQVPVEEIANTAADVLKKLDRTLASDEIPGMLKFLAQASERLDRLLNEVHDNVPKLMNEIHDTADAARNTLTTAQSALTEARTTLATADHLLATDAREAIRVATAALQRLGSRPEKGVHMIRRTRCLFAVGLVTLGACADVDVPQERAISQDINASRQQAPTSLQPGWSQTNLLEPAPWRLGQ